MATLHKTDAHGVSRVVTAAVIADFMGALRTIDVHVAFTGIYVPRYDDVMPLIVVDPFASSNPINAPSDDFDSAVIGSLGSP